MRPWAGKFENVNLRIPSSVNLRFYFLNVPFRVILRVSSSQSVGCRAHENIPTNDDTDHRDRDDGSHKHKKHCTFRPFQFPALTTYTTMAMRLSMTSTSLQTFEMDVNVSNVSKSEVLKFLSVIIQNLLKSGDDPKYRQLRLSNAKIQRMTAHAAVMSYFQQVVGFETIQENGESLLRIVRAVPSESSLESALKEVTCARERIESRIPKTVSNSSSANSLPEILTAKQKTRKMMEEKAVLEKLAVKNA